MSTGHYVPPLIEASTAMNTVQEQLNMFHDDKVTGKKKMTLKKYSKERGWPIPFGMDENAEGYRVEFADGSATWLGTDEFNGMYGDVC